MAPRTIILDFETFYSAEYHLNPAKNGGLSTPLYILDPRFKVHGMAVDDGVTQEFVPADKVRDRLEEYRNDILVFHNSFFDLGVLAWHYKFRPAFIIDTLLLANHVLGSARDGGGGRNDLASLATKLNLPLQKGKEIEQFKGERNLDEYQFSILAQYAMKDAKLTRMVLDRLLPQVTNQDFELWLLDHTLRIYSEKLLGVDVVKLKATRFKVQERLDSLIVESGVEFKLLSGTKDFSAELLVRLKRHKLKFPTKRRPFTEHEKKKAHEKRILLGKYKVVSALSKQDVVFTALAECGVREVEVLVQARLAAKSAITVFSRLNTMEAYARVLGGIPVHLVYYGAHTGRFAGGGGFNFQNLTSPGRAATPFDREVATLVRECLIPLVPGNVFVAVDAAQIEARVVAWLAGEVELIEAFEAGKDVYSLFIADVLGKEVRKPVKEDPPALAAELKLNRGIGKEAVLGLGFGMGVDKFEVRLKSNKDVRAMIERGDLTRETIEGIVAGYRTKYQQIVQLWADYNSAFKDAIGGATRHVGVVTFEKHGPRAVKIMLPSGRALYYRDLRSERVPNPYGGTRTEWKHGRGQKIYGGLLTENIVQAIARDVLAEQGILASEDAGYRVALHVHDEVVAEVPGAQGQEVHDFLVRSLSTAPAWATGLPLGAEGSVAKNLSK